jgi:centractin
MSDLERTKLQQVFLETFNFPSILFLSEGQAIISTINKTNGVMVNIGESNTSITSILHGFINPVARDVFPISGKDLTTYLLNLIVKGKGAVSNFYIDKWIAKEIKEKTALCVLDPKKEMKQVKEGVQKYNQTISLPNNYSLKINMERFLLSEPLFDPKLIHIDYKGLDEAIAEVIKLWERESWEELISNIILAGGGTLIQGFKERLSQELIKHFPEKIRPKINLIAASGRENISWIGASILYIKNQLQKGWITRSD